MSRILQTFPTFSHPQIPPIKDFFLFFRQENQSPKKNNQKTNQKNQPKKPSKKPIKKKSKNNIKQ